MATTPRAGIINLNFKDVSQMAQNIADNDPWKLGIETAGKVLTDREKHILYQRALADAQGKDRPEDKTAGDAFSWLKDKWDRLDIRSPFEETLTEGTKTESPITETASEKGSREMIGYKPNQSPIETDKYRTNLKAPERANVEPNDELSFGFNQDVGQGEENASPIIPFATGEQTPEQIGVKVDFGTSEPKTDYTKLRSPFAMREKAEESEAVAPEKAQESGSPFGATEAKPQKIKAPRMSEMEAWSEMNRLNPERAKFDYDRVQNQKKVDIETLKALGKDANLDDIRAMHNAYLNQKTALYNQGFDDSDPRVQAADAYIKYTGNLLAEKGLLPKSTDSTETGKYEKDNDKLREARSLARNAISTAVDSDKNKVVDNAKEIREKLNDIRLEYNINPNSQDWKTILSEWQSQIEDIEGASAETIRKTERAQDKAEIEKDKRLAQEDKYEWLYVAYTDLQKNPTDVSNKAYAVQAALRKESGAAIAQDEFLGAMTKLLPPDKYEQLISELGGLGGLAASLSGQKETYLSNVLARYMPYADSNKILGTYLGPKIEPYYKFKKLKSGGASKQAKGKNKYGL